MNREEFEKAMEEVWGVGFFPNGRLPQIHNLGVKVLYEILEELRYMNNPPQLRGDPDISYTTRKLDGTIHNG